jgi:transcriptional regulator with PAS, ATPase and Fis domain
MPPPPTRHRFTAEDVTLATIQELGGGAVVILDRELRIIGSTARADALLGPLPRGVSGPKVLCGGATQRPVAEALAAGRAVTAMIPFPGRVDERLRVSAVPVHRAGTRAGWALLIDEESVGADGPELFHGLWSGDAAMKRMFRIIEKVARTDATVLVRGDTGAGKELVATAVHALSPRASGPFRAINCAAVPAPLLESELFGHARGAFTGAVRDAPGHFKLAHKGTLFLDEVAELSLDLQAKLLRVLETHSVMPVGAREPVAVDVRIVSATHRALRKDVETGRFRADLMYRLRVIPIFIPPLRARGADVVLLAERFVDEMNPRSPRKIGRIAPAAKAALTRYAWPGNVRELRNVLEYAFAIGEGPVLAESDLPPELSAAAAGDDAVTARASATPPMTDAVPATPEAAKLLRAIERAGGSRARAAQSLGISRITLWRRMKELGLIARRRG